MSFYASFGKPSQRSLLPTSTDFAFPCSTTLISSALLSYIFLYEQRMYNQTGHELLCALLSLAEALLFYFTVPTSIQGIGDWCDIISTDTVLPHPFLTRQTKKFTQLSLFTSCLSGISRSDCSRQPRSPTKVRITDTTSCLHDLSLTQICISTYITK